MGIFMIGHNFIQQSNSGYQPVVKAHEGNTEVEPSQTLPSTSNSFDDLEKLNLLLNDYMASLTKEWGDYSFHIIANQVARQQFGEELIFSASEMEELEIEPLDIKRNPEKAARAIHAQAFVALRKPDGTERSPDAKFASKWADLIENGKIKHLKVRNQEGEIEQNFDVKEIEITRFTLGEVNHISTIILKAVGISQQITTFQQQQKERETRRTKDQEERENRERQFREELLVQRFQELVKNLRMISLGQNDLALQDARRQLPDSEGLIMQIIAKHAEEVKEQEKIEKEREKKAAILKKDIEYFKSRKENIAHDNLSRDIKQSEMR